MADTSSDVLSWVWDCGSSLSHQGTAPCQAQPEEPLLSVGHWRARDLGQCLRCGSCSFHAHCPSVLFPGCPQGGELLETEGSHRL